MANQVVLSGRLTKDPELKKTQTGKSVVSINLAVSNNYGGERGADFLPITFWNATADAIAKYTTKGSHILVIGRLQQRSYEGEGGTRYVIDVLANSFEFLDSKNSKPKDEEAHETKETQVNTQEDDFYQSSKDVATDEDLPF